MICHSKCQEKNQLFAVELCGFQAGFNRPTRYGLQASRRSPLEAVWTRNVKCVEDPGNVPLRPHGKTNWAVPGPLGGDRVGNLSTSSLSSFPLFWQPSTLTDSNTTELLSMNWTWTHNPKHFTTRLPRVRVLTKSRPDVWEFQRSYSYIPFGKDLPYWFEPQPINALHVLQDWIIYSSLWCLDSQQFSLVCHSSNGTFIKFTIPGSSSFSS